MNDCSNADVRDLLPDLLHGRLDASLRASVNAHVAGCADCQAEVALLRDLRGVLLVAPALDLAAITAAVPAYRAPARRAWVGWRAAAAIAVLVAGGASVAVLGRGPASTVDVATSSTGAVSSTNTIVASGAPTPTASADVASTTAAMPAAGGQPVYQRPAASGIVPDAGELAFAEASLTDLSDRELDALLRDIESLDGVPTTDVDAAVVSPMPPAAPARVTP